nr:uncharacterized protein LOC123767055 [Procambarus clarkii]
MAEPITTSTLQKNTAAANTALAHGQPVPLTFEQLSFPKVKISKSIARRPVHIPVQSTSLAEGFNNTESPVPALVTASNCLVTSISSQVDNLVVMKAKCEPLGLSSECKVPSKGGCLQRILNHSSNNSEGSAHETDNVLATINTNSGVDSNTIVIREDMAGCMVMNLEGNMVVQEHPSAQAPAEPYLVDEQLLVQVTQEHEPERAHTSDSTNNSRILHGSISYVKGTTERSIFDDDIRKNLSRKPEDKKIKINVNTKFNFGSKIQNQSNFESRWNFHASLAKSECPLVIKASQDDLKLEDESEAENFGRPRRKSAKKARLKWKNIHDVDNIGKIGMKKTRHLHFLSRNKHLNKIENPMETIANEQVAQDLPVWAQHLTSVQVLDNKWVVGVASSSEILHQTLEGHSRSVLCDYIKSHPSSLQQRHLARSQASRIMWNHQRIKFDGVPFTILSSDDLKCAFGMNYKIKRKDAEKTAENRMTDRTEGNFEHEKRISEASEDTVARQAHKDRLRGGVINDSQPKKRYKDVTFTSCTARINVKVIVKYPGYAVPYNAMATERKVMLKALRRDMSQGLTLEKEELYHITLPLSVVHNHPLQGRSRSIHPSITNKIKELICEGVTAPKSIKGILDSHVEMQHVGDMVVPQPDDRAYYPRLKDIANLVYTLCKKMGISAKRKVSSEQVSFEMSQRKKRKQKRTRFGENETGCCDNVMSNSAPLQASTLQEAVQTFCTDEPDRGSLGDLEGRECISTDVLPRDRSGEAASFAEMVRVQLDTLRSLTYSLHEVGGLQELYQSLQVILNQYMANQHHTLPEGIAEAPATTAFIIQDSMVDPLSSSASSAQGVPESTEHLVISERNETGSVVTNKPRSAQSIGSQHVRQLRPPVALQCLTTSMVPTLAVSQLPRTTGQNPHQTHTHIVTSVSHSGSSSAATTIPAPTFQTLGPATQDSPHAPVHLSLPPYFYYVQEVTVPESSQNWTYTPSS